MYKPSIRDGDFPTELTQQSKTKGQRRFFLSLMAFVAVSGTLFRRLAMSRFFNPMLLIRGLSFAMLLLR